VAAKSLAWGAVFLSVVVGLGALSRKLHLFERRSGMVWVLTLVGAISGVCLQDWRSWVDCRMVFDTAVVSLASLGGVWVRELVVAGIAGRMLREAARCAYLASMSSASRRAARDRARTSAVAIDTPTGRDIAGMSLVVVDVR
jgi:hypothetical protein